VSSAERIAQLEAELAEARRDPLTALDGRGVFLDRLARSVERARHDQTRLAVLFVDMDGFKDVNDTLGHAAGDSLLVDIAARLRSAVRTHDITARLGGDEFAVLIDDLTDVAEAVSVAERINAALRTPFWVAGRPIVISASVGIGTGPAEGDAAQLLLRDADLAMYRAKREGPGRHVVFEPAMHAAFTARVEMTEDLHRAVERGQLRLAFQPVMELATHRVAGLEALVRWHHPTRGVVPPGDFIPLAEESGSIHTIGAWVLDAACRRYADWRRHVPAVADINLAVNLSARQLHDPDLVDGVARTLQRWSVPLGRLVFEITETAVLSDDSPTVVGRLSRLRDLGIPLALDDFGTGYSSLSHLTSLPIDIVKIDRSFVAGLGRSRRKTAVVAAVLALGRELGLDTVAEGIETVEQLELVQTLGCQYGQGHLYARPLDGDDVERFIAGRAEMLRILPVA
jgi:diguanylate cyclase (GGDEF)-like protein